MGNREVRIKKEKGGKGKTPFGNSARALKKGGRRDR
jgi:hypothetical protein